METTLTTAHTPTTSAIMTEASSTSIEYEQTGSSSSSTVSQSPLQRGDEENNNINHSCHNNNNTESSNATTTTNLQRQQSSKNTNTNAIRNPYKKQAVDSSSKNNDNPNNTKRSQFIEKYRLQSVHNRQRAIAAGHTSASAATSKTALEVLKLNQKWRQNWRRQCRNNNNGGGAIITVNDNHKKGCCHVALRPRLFLFQRMMKPQVKAEGDDSTTTVQQSQQQQNRHGVWELGTGITELSGEGGSGKTQMCLSLCMTCALTPLLFPEKEESIQSNNNNNYCYNNNSHNYQSHYTSIYISMGGGIPQSKLASRLHQMLEHRLLHHHEATTPEDVECILSRIWLLTLKNEDEFIDFVEVHLPNILNNQLHGSKPRQHQHQSHHTNNDYPTCDKIGFIAFDGIANFFRFSDPLFQQYHSNSNHHQRSVFHQNRSSKLFHLSSLLRRMSDLYDVPIVVTNQVTMSIPSDDGLLLKQQPPTTGTTTTTTAVSGVGRDNAIQPALGLIWSNCVTTRYMLHRKDGLMANISTTSSGGGGSNDEGDSNVNKKKEIIRRQRVRKACVLQSVCTPDEREVWYFIDTGAVVAVS